MKNQQKGIEFVEDGALLGISKIPTWTTLIIPAQRIVLKADGVTVFDDTCKRFFQSFDTLIFESQDGTKATFKKEEVG